MICSCFNWPGFDESFRAYETLQILLEADFLLAQNGACRPFPLYTSRNVQTTIMKTVHGLWNKKGAKHVRVIFVKGVDDNYRRWGQSAIWVQCHTNIPRHKFPWCRNEIKNMQYLPDYRFTIYDLKFKAIKHSTNTMGRIEISWGDYISSWPWDFKKSTFVP